MSSQPAPPKPLLSPPPNSSLTGAPKNSDPIARLDALLETYLDRLDTYQKLREKLSKNFSAGFLSLAHANRTSNLGSGRRYGEEAYDERMKAGRRVKIHTKDEGDLRRPMQKDLESDGKPVPDSDTRAILFMIEQFSPSELDSGDPAKSPVPEGTPAQALNHSSDNPPANFESTAPNSTIPSFLPQPMPASTSALPSTQPPKQNTNQLSKPKKPVNPLNWYGLLIPPSLRAAQISFTSAVKDQIPQLLSIQAETADLEVQIRALREEVGLAHDHAQETDSTTDNTSTMNAEAKDLQAIPKDGPPSSPLASGKTSSTKTLSSRTKGPPRSRVLKLDS